MKSKILTILLLLGVPVYTSDVEIKTEDRIYKDAASLGMGGVGVSTIGYQNSVMRNPANLGLMSEYDITPFFSLGMYVNHNAAELYDTVYSIVDTGLDSLNYDSLINQSPSIGFNGPLNLGYMSNGFGIWTTTSLDSSITLSPSECFSDMDISMNDLAGAMTDVEKLLNSSSDITATDIQDILKSYLSDSSMTDEEMLELAEKFVEDGVDVDALIKTLLPLAQLATTAEIAVNVAYGFHIPFAAIDDVSGLSLGATLRFAQRYKVSSGYDGDKNIYDVAKDLISIKDNIYHASSISSDVGMSLRFENFILAAAVRDAFSSSFEWKDFDDNELLGYSSKIPMSIDFGASYRLYFNNNFIIQEAGLYVEFEDAMNECTTWANKLRMGSEFKLLNFLNARVGVYKEYITGGIGIGFKWFRMDFAYYREQYLNIYSSDQYYLNMTVGLSNSPERKEKSTKKQLAQDRIQAQNLTYLSQSLDGI